MGLDVSLIDQALIDQDMQHPVEQGNVGPRLEWQMQIGDLGTFREARIGNNDFELRIRRLGIFNVAEDDWMSDGRVSTGNKNHFGLQNVFVAARRSISPQCLLVAGNSRRHAKA